MSSGRITERPVPANLYAVETDHLESVDGIAPAASEKREYPSSHLGLV
jgi:hypothetical protein